MKTLKLILLLFIANFCNAQTIKGIITDSITGNVIPFANIVLKKGKGTYSDEFGKFELSVKNKFTDTLYVSNIGYEPKVLPVSSFTINMVFEISLNPKTERLNEVVIPSKKIKYGQKEILGEKRDGNIGMTSLIGFETAVFIENPKNRTGKVNGIYINLKKRKNADYVATFNVKFYQYDSINNSPGKLLHNKNLYVQPRNKKYRLWVNVKDLDIRFPKKGICIGIEMVNTHGKVKKYTAFGPMFRYTRPGDEDSRTWSNYHNTGWKGFNTQSKKHKRIKKGALSPMIGVEVEYVLNN